jgi:hypothetical protein
MYENKSNWFATGSSKSAILIESIDLTFIVRDGHAVGIIVTVWLTVKRPESDL